MSVQLLLQGRLLGIPQFLVSESSGNQPDAGKNGEALFAGRAAWSALLAEVLPRALLAELGLSKILLGASGGGQFLVVLPGEAREVAQEFLVSAAAEIAELSGSALQLIWAFTENLGDWTDIRRRLNEESKWRREAPLAGGPGEIFEPYESRASFDATEYFSRDLGRALPGATGAGWSPEMPGRVALDGGKHTWPFGQQAGPEEIPFSRHWAPGDSDEAAGLDTLARRADGQQVWGVLRGDVDNFGVRLRRAQNIEEYVQLSTLYKRFFAGELAVLCSLPDFWRKVAILYAGGNDFAVCGAWDALPLLAREIQRLFHRLSEENLKELPGPEGKTVSMAIATAPSLDTPLAAVYEEAGRRLAIAKSAGKDSIHVFGRTLEWKHLADACELKETLIKMAREYGSARQFFFELASVYRKGGPDPGTGGVEQRFDRPWRFHRRIHRVLGGMKDREFQKLRSHLIQELSGRGAAQVRLRPAGRVALEWARLGTEG